MTTTKRTAKTPKAHTPSQYNATVWRVQDGEAFSVSVVEIVDGRVLRHNGVSCTGYEGRPEFHTYFMEYMGRFCGKYAELYVTPGTGAFKKALGGNIAKTFKSVPSSPLS